ncbi:MAG: cobyrinate a,c-diamide synthase [Pseudomonadota bacterium]
MRGLAIAAPSSGAGKTMLTLGLLAALRRRGVPVAAAKSGPDYIDPAFHAAASGRPSVNLDAWAMAPRRLRALAAAQGGEVLILEGAMGLFDGAPDGRGATADVAAALGLPVVLVLDVAAQGQTAAAVAAGLARHRPDVAVAGVILNRIGSPRHAEMVRHAMAAVGLPVVGAVPRTDGMEVPSRHLGLVQAREQAGLSAALDAAAAAVAEHVDLDALLALAAPLPPAGGAPTLPPLGQRIAVADDDAFAFTYRHHLTDWRGAGAEILPFSPLADEAPDGAADAIFLPGGYPELHAGRLAAATTFKAAMQAAAARGVRTYGECGGFMVLGEALVDAEGTAHPMLGLLQLETSFAERRLHLGYRRLQPMGGPWSGPLFGHEFHYSTMVRAEGAPLFQATDSTGADLGPIGLRQGSVMGSYAHLIDAVDPG